MNMRSRSGERGMALLALVAVLAAGSSWYLVSRLNNESSLAAAVRKQRDAAVLNRAKQALIGYVAAQAANSGEANPGALPCPEAGGYFDNPSQEGQTASSCALPKVGRFPWRTIGTEKLIDSAGEPLWYVVSAGWAVPSAGANTNINSSTLGQITVDGAPNAAVALIIAPGAAFNVPACGANAAISQARSTVGSPDWRNYLECENATFPTPDAIFATRGTSGVFNDQVVTVTAADLLPGIEAAIAKRVERDIVPALNGVYTPAVYGFGGANPVYPYAASFGAPNPGSANTYQGSAGNYQGLLPFNLTQGCNPATDVRCTTTMLVFSKAGADIQTGGGGYIRTQSTCSWQATEYVCIGEYFMPTISVTLTINVTNVAMGLRTFDTSKVSFVAHDNCACGGIGTQTVPFTSAVALNANGSATVTISGGPVPDITAAMWGTYANYEIRIDRSAFGDHSLLDTANATTGWFARNEWFRQTYYAVAAGHTAGTLPPSCTTGTNCLSVLNITPTSAQRAILILAGRSVNGNARPSAALTDYLESGNATGAFTRNTVSAGATLPVAQRFNDRIVVVGSN